MKSEKAKQYLKNNREEVEINWETGETEWMIWPKDARKAVEIAEQDAEARMRRKAVQAFDDMWFSGLEPDYEYHRRNFIKKLNEI